MVQTDKQTDTQTDGHCDSKTESAHWENSVKKHGLWKKCGSFYLNKLLLLDHSQFDEIRVLNPLEQLKLNL